MREHTERAELPPPSSRRGAASARGGQPASSRVALRRLALRLSAKEPRPSAPLTLRDFIAMPPEQRPLFVVSDGIGVDSTAMLRAAGLPVPRKSSCVFCPASKPWEIAELVRDWPEIADRIVEIEDTARPHLREIEGLWRKAIKGMRGAVARPGSMAVFIRALRADPALLRRYLDMAPAEPIAVGDDIGAVPTFKGTPASVSKRKRLPLAPAAHAPEPASWALAGGVA
jgi:hypothetical protein